MTKLQLMLLLPTVLFLNACAPFKPNSTHAGTCNELNSRMIFSGTGNTADIRQGQIQDVDRPLIERNYDTKCE